MRHPCLPWLYLGLLAALGLPAGLPADRGQPPEFSVHTGPLARLPAKLEVPLGVSTDGRTMLLKWQLVGDFPGSDMDVLEVARLSGGHRQITSASNVEATLVAGGSGLAYWARYNYNPVPILAYVPTSSHSTRWRPRTYQEPTDVSSAGLDWSQRAGQLAMTRTRDEHPSEVLVAHLPLKSTRVIARFPDSSLSKPMWSPEGDALTVEVYKKSPAPGVWEPDLYLLNSANGQRRKLLKGRNLGWLRHGVLLAAEVVGNDHVHNIEAVSRVDVRTREKRLLSTGVGTGWPRMSPFMRWLGWYDESRHGIDLLNTASGKRLQLPMKSVRIFTWGRSDRELFYRDEEFWHRAVLQLPP